MMYSFIIEKTEGGFIVQEIPTYESATGRSFLQGKRYIKITKEEVIKSFDLWLEEINSYKKKLEDLE